MRLIFVLSIVFSGLIACNKSADGLKSYSDSLAGKWRYVEYFASTGGPGSWYAVNPVTQWIELRANGVVSSNLAPFKDATSYSLPDSNTIKFIIPSAQDGYMLFQYKIDTVQPALIFGFLKPLCIEGCAVKFKR